MAMGTVWGEDQDPESYLRDMAEVLYDSSWLTKIMDYSTSLAGSARTYYFTHCFGYRLSHLQGMIDAARTRLPTESRQVEDKYYRSGRHIMTTTLRAPECARDCYKCLWHMLESICTREKNNPEFSARQQTILGRVAYLRGMHDELQGTVHI